MYQLPEEKLQPGMTLAAGPGAAEAPSAPLAPLNDPAAFKMQPGPTGAKYLPQEAPPVQPTQGPQQAPPADDYWTEERKAFARKIYNTASQYGKMVQQRRQKRSVAKEYNHLKSQLDKEAGTYTDLKNMQEEYGALYGVDASGEPNPHAIALQRQQAKHLQAITRLQAELRKKAQDANKKYGIPLDKSGGLMLDDDGADDQQFDRFVQQGAIDLSEYQAPQ